MSEVCPDVGIEPTLQPVTEEQFQLRTTNREDGLALMLWPRASGATIDRVHFLMSGSSTRTHLPIAAPPWPRATEETRWRRRELMNSV